MSDNKSLNTTHQVHFIKNILISNIRSFSEVFKPMLPPDSTIIKQCIPHTLCVFSTSQDVLCKIKSFCWHQMIHGRKLLKKNEIVLKDFNEGLIKEVLHHWIGFSGTCITFFSFRSCQMILAWYRQTHWTSGQLKNMHSTDSTWFGPQYVQLLSMMTEIRPCNVFIAITLWRTGQRKVASLCVLYLCQMRYHLGKVKGGISFFHFHKLVSWEPVV